MSVEIPSLKALIRAISDTTKVLWSATVAFVASQPSDEAPAPSVALLPLTHPAALFAGKRSIWGGWAVQDPPQMGGRKDPEAIANAWHRECP